MSEAQFAGALLNQPDLWWRNQVPPEDFQDPVAAKVVATVADMLRAGAEVDVVAVSEKSGVPLERVGRLAMDCYAPGAAVSAARIIREAAAHRKAEALAETALEAIRSGGDPTAELQRALEQVVTRGGESVPIGGALEAYRERAKRPRKKSLISPISTLNELLPMEGGRLITVAGRPGTFKSAFMLHTARYSAMRGLPVGIVSLEMPVWEIGERYAKQGDGGEDAPLYLNCHAARLQDIEAQIIEWKERDKVAGVAIDYLQLVHCEAPKQMRRDEVVGIITRRLKLLAMRLDIPVMLLAQMNREVERHGRRPMLSDLRESGNIEQDSDAVLFIHKREVDGQEEYELIVAKHRGGQTGKINLHIDKPRFRLMEAAR